MNGGVLKNIIKIFKSFGSWGYVLLFLIGFAIASPLVSNDKPIYCQYEGEKYFPLFGNGIKTLEGRSYKEINLTSSVFPLVPFGPKEISPYDKGLSKPLTKHQFLSRKFTHYLGTDRIGRDVLAGIIYGLRTALIIGFGTMFLAGFLGILWGLLAGYYENNGLKLSLIRLIGYGICLLIGIYILFVSFYYLSYGLASHVFIYFILWIIGFVLCHFFLKRVDQKYKSVKLNIPLDRIFLQQITIFNTIPGLLFLFLMLTIVEKPSVGLIILILGFLSWTSIARYARAETIKVKALPFMMSLRNFEVNARTILLKHVLPNILSPLLTSASFIAAGAILAESFLSFLGLGLGIEEVTWGSLLNQSRHHFAAWWLAVFPGLALFFTLWLFIKIGQKANKIIDPYYGG